MSFWSHVREVFGYHKPDKSFKVNRGTSQDFAICVYCKREIVRVAGRWTIA